MSTVRIPKILIPNKKVDMQKWSTIACDQFCARPKYWEELESFVGDAPSTLRLTCPEVYLPKGDLETRINDVQNEMKKYLAEGLFDEYENFVLVEREVENGKKRVGVMIAIDLDKYNWERVRVPIRATEGTLVERLPVRIKIRKGAPIELPHAIILIDNPERDIIEPIYAKKDTLQKLYDFELNMGGGRVSGYKIEDSKFVLDKLAALLDADVQIKKYGVDAGIQFAVGDGNHSIATAKVMWEELKSTLSEVERENHPSRYMLVEMVNLYGEGMDFKPIHRLIYNPTPDFIVGLKAALSGEGKLKVVSKDRVEYIDCPIKASLTISGVQGYIESYLKQHPEVEVEYVHNESHLMEALMECGGLGIVLPDFPNNELVNFVVNVGNLPKKAFSIGEPEHKRYYLECKSIINN
ncbi:MAG: DUF1015 family protein [Clostridia bacterium]|nr:DUF1015 family protein [Clostridia bacterium]